MSGRLPRNVFVKIKYIGYMLALNCVKVKKIIKYYMFFREKKEGHLIEI
jgi:hypothetical protein